MQALSENELQMKGMIFVMPRSSSAWNGAEALWITVAGWAAAAERLLGSSFVVTTDRIATHQEVINYPLAGNSSTGRSKSGSIIPQVLKTLVKDVLLWRKRNRKNYEEGPWKNINIICVWEQHDMFAGPGRKIADALGVPLVIYVHAPVVWEAAKWRVRRPLWGQFLEKYYEAASLKKADLVACVSQEVADKLGQMGVDPNKIIVSPMSVDSRRFSERQDDADVRRKLNLENKFVFGWTGSFRGFHGLDSVVRVFARVSATNQNVVLILVGDGGERQSIEALAAELAVSEKVIFTGKVPFVKIPLYVNLFDVAIVSAGTAADFHYSPLKLREYLVAFRPTLVPLAGEIPKLFEDGKEVLTYKVGDLSDMQEKMEQMLWDADLRKTLGENGHQKIMTRGTWEFELKKTLTKLGITF
jgi:glycosyltransferase involved in cell wall biosynthesis